MVDPMNSSLSCLLLRGPDSKPIHQLYFPWVFTTHPYFQSEQWTNKPGN